MTEMELLAIAQAWEVRYREGGLTKAGCRLSKNDGINSAESPGILLEGFDPVERITYVAE